MITLMRPDVRLHRSYLDAHDEFDGAPRDGDGVWTEPADGHGHAGVLFTREEMETSEGFARFVAWRLDQALEESPRTRGHVPCTFLWVVDDRQPDTYLASASVRHRLTPFLLEVGGHIGYSVRPSARRRGAATEALRLLLPHAAVLGIDPALITCDVDNIGSATVIEANGGVLEDVRGDKKRYWVPTGA
ncbi:MAG TPA: GNAT family N-acetyltransferase [Ornithinibacter sp.]|nr:GNAT family N-acetyltransferase [Ornithinibacter sp.]